MVCVGGALLSWTWILRVSIFIERQGNDEFSDSPRRADSKNAHFNYFFCVPDRTHVGVAWKWPDRRAPPLCLEKGARNSPPFSWSNLPPALEKGPLDRAFSKGSAEGCCWPENGRQTGQKRFFFEIAPPPVQMT